MMPNSYHHDVRTTLTLDDDVIAKIRAEMRRSGRSFKDTVNDLLRAAFTARRGQKAVEPFVVKARPLGMRPGLSYDCVWALIEQIEGPGHK
jgi:plasmid stability protein